MKQRIVIKVQMTCDKCRKNALALAGKTSGVQSVGIEGEERDQLVVVGDSVDAIGLTNSLRKKVKTGRAEIMKLELVVDEEPAAAETAAASDPNPAAGWLPQWYPYNHPGHYCPAGPGVVVRPYAAGHCYPVEDPCADEEPRCTIM